MDILLQFAIFLIVMGVGRLLMRGRGQHKLNQAIEERDKALNRLKELQR